MGEPLGGESLFPDRRSGEGITVQLARRLREAIETGALAAGSRMLGTRQFAKHLGIGRNTVMLAYEQLSAEGYLETRNGAGTFVARSVRTRAPLPRSDGALAPAADAARWIELRTHFRSARGEGPLRPGMPDLTAFPALAWTRSMRRTAQSLTSELGYGSPAGEPVLREAIAAHIRQFRGITTDPGHVIVVEGAQAAFHLIASVLTNPGDHVALEDPGYALARAVFESHGLKIDPVPVDDDGLLVAALPAQARLAFVTPTHQFPLGGTLPVARRSLLLDWAAAAERRFIVEDDYDSEFTSMSRPLPPLATLDRDERVIYVGSFSKTLAPGLRVGYIVAPPHLARAFVIARACSSLGVGVALQATLADFIARGHFARHIRRMNVRYDRRRAILLEALRPVRNGRFRTGPSQTGLHVALIARGDYDDVGAVVTNDGQRLVALSRLCLQRSDCRGFVLGFTNGSDVAIERAAYELTRTLTARDRTASAVRGSA